MRKRPGRGGKGILCGEKRGRGKSHDIRRDDLAERFFDGGLDYRDCRLFDMAGILGLRNGAEIPFMEGTDSG